jgi:hypothetical protein
MELLPLMEKYGIPIAFLVIGVVTGYKKYWVWGYQLADCQAAAIAAVAAAERREQEWKELAFAAWKIGKGAVEIAKERRP